MASTIVWEQRLARGRHGDVWRIRGPGGARMVAKQVSGATPAQRARLRTLVRRGRDCAAAAGLYVDSVVVAGEVWLLRAYDPGVPLTRVAALTSMGQRQLAAIAAGCLHALSELHAAGLTHGGVRSSNVFVEADGSIHLVDAGLDAALLGRSRRGRPASDVADVAALLCSIWPERLRARGPMLRELLDSGRLAGSASAEAALALLDDAFPTDHGFITPDVTLAAVAARLLVPASASAIAPPPPEAGHPIRDDATRLEQARRTLTEALAAGRRRHLRRTLAAAAVVAAAAAASGGFMLAAHIPRHAAGTGAVSRQAQRGLPAAPSPTPAPSPSPPPRPSPPGLQPAAPAAAGFISQAQLVPFDPCAPGQRCTVKTVVNLNLPHASSAISWELVAVDRCTGAQSVLATWSITADPAWVDVWASTQVTMRSDDPVLLYTVATAPWRVASAPLAAGAASSCGARV